MQQVLVLWDGDFGAAVARRIVARLNGQAGPGPTTASLNGARPNLSAMVATADKILVALSRERVSDLRTLDRLCRETGRPWGLAYLDDARLTCGPFFQPGRTACYDCFRRRRLTHLPVERPAAWDAAIHRAAERNPDFSLSGFPPSFVDMAATVLADGDPRVWGGRLIGVEHSGAVAAGLVLPLHGCLCRGEAGEPAGRRFCDSPALRVISGHLGETV